MGTHRPCVCGGCACPVTAIDFGDGMFGPFSYTPSGSWSVSGGKLKATSNEAAGSLLWDVDRVSRAKWQLGVSAKVLTAGGVSYSDSIKWGREAGQAVLTHPGGTIDAGAISTGETFAIEVVESGEQFAVTATAGGYSVPVTVNLSPGGDTIPLGVYHPSHSGGDAFALYEFDDVTVKACGPSVGSSSSSSSSSGSSGGDVLGDGDIQACTNVGLIARNYELVTPTAFRFKNGCEALSGVFILRQSSCSPYNFSVSICTHQWSDRGAPVSPCGSAIKSPAWQIIWPVYGNTDGATLRGQIETGVNASYIHYRTVNTALSYNKVGEAIPFEYAGANAYLLGQMEGTPPTVLYATPKVYVQC